MKSHITLSFIVPAEWETLYLETIDDNVLQGRSIEILVQINECLQAYEQQSIEE